MQAIDIFYSPPRPKGRPSLQQQAERIARQQTRERFIAQQQAVSSTSTSPQSNQSPQSPVTIQPNATQLSITQRAPEIPVLPTQRRHRYRHFSSFM